MGQLSPFRPKPSSQVFNDNADIWINLLKSYNRTWICLHCKTETNYVEHLKTGSKPCYNCGSTSGEIK